MELSRILIPTASPTVSPMSSPLSSPPSSPTPSDTIVVQPIGTRKRKRGSDAVATPTMLTPSCSDEQLRFAAALKYRGQLLSWQQVTDCFLDHYGKNTAIGRRSLRDSLRVAEEKPDSSLYKALKNKDEPIPEEYRTEIEAILEKYGHGLWSATSEVDSEQRRKSREMRFITTLRLKASPENRSWAWVASCFIIEFNKSLTIFQLSQRWYKGRKRDEGLFDFLVENDNKVPPRFEDEVENILKVYNGKELPNEVVVPRVDDPNLKIDRGFRYDLGMIRFITILRHCVKDLNWAGTTECFHLDFAEELDMYKAGHRPLQEALKQAWYGKRDKLGSFWTNLRDYNSIEPEFEKEVDEVLAKYGKDPSMVIRPHVIGKSPRGSWWQQTEQMDTSV